MNNPDASAKPSRFIYLNFVNKSNSAINTPVVVLQKNGLNPESAIAWQVIQNFRQGDNYQLIFPKINEVSVSDPVGRFTPFQEANPGTAFQMRAMSFGMQLSATGVSHDPNSIDVINLLPQLAVDVNIFKGGALLSTKAGLNPGQTASFVFSPTIFVGLAQEITEGQQIFGDALSNINTEISLTGIASADVVLTGGGGGSSSTPYQFTLENVVMA